jgi:mannose-6-phosphate isomerase-like protein (cupin superfamily)
MSKQLVACAFDFEQLLQRRAAVGRPSLEFLRSRAMSLMVYTLPVGGPDPQQPHGEDEVYVVMRGRARLAVGTEDHEIGPGSILYVPARMEHRFHSIIEPLEILVAFAPPRSGTARRRQGSRAAQ